MESKLGGIYGKKPGKNKLYFNITELKFFKAMYQRSHTMKFSLIPELENSLYFLQ
uniref:Uncharacterized protein n=1 Tax=Planktothrix agardhii TaxID=1160 RepID=A0A1J1JA31_PLAAG|nr:protein of unknown function [Planktothrix agardhii]